MHFSFPELIYFRFFLIECFFCLSDHIFNHSFQSHFPAIIRRIDAADPVCLQLFNFRWKDGSPAATKNADMSATAFRQQVFQVFKEFNMSALVRSDGNGLYIFFDRRFRNFLYTPVMPEMNHLHALALKYPAHDIDGGIMSVEERSGRQQPDALCGIVHWKGPGESAKLL